MSTHPARRNARLGLALFFLYSAFYAAFVLTAAFAPQAMEVTPLAGLNVAVLSGFGLIVLALGLALVYGFATRTRRHHAHLDASHDGPS